MIQKSSILPSLSLAVLIATHSIMAQAAPAPRRASSQAASLHLDAKSRALIVLPQHAELPEKTAARELKDYLSRITGGTFTIASEGAVLTTPHTPAIYVGATQFAARANVAVKSLQSEEWRIRSKGNALILVGGGTRGTLYAAYHLLEDQAGVHWWNPWEETVPKLKSLNLSHIDRRGKPVFIYRDIHQTYGNDNGRFVARSRLNRDGDAYYLENRDGKSTFAKEYGGTVEYGPPYQVHTFYKYISPAKYYAEHPDWFVIKGEGPPTSQNSQLRLSNSAMRQEFLKLLRENIRTARAAAKAKDMPPPVMFGVSQEDNVEGFATLEDADLLRANDGAESAILLDFINFLADGIKDEFPDTYIDTLAYYNGERVPKTIRPRDNVIIRLTDTTSNLILPIKAERNYKFRRNIEDWSKITKHLRVWDYGVTYNYPGLPTPTLHTYPIDLRFMAQHHVEGMFNEHEYALVGDLRDLKVWMLAKLLEDPNRDYNSLLRQITDGFYGPAGPLIREYIAALEKAAATPVKSADSDAKATIADVDWFAIPAKHSYLNFDFVQRAHAIFDRATIAVAKNPVLARRVRHARMPLDRATVLLFKPLLREWRLAGGTHESIPLQRDAIATRYLKTWNEQIDLRILPAEQATERAAADAEVKKLTSVPVYLPPPTRFRDLPRENILTYSVYSMKRSEDMAKITPDPALERGNTARFEILDKDLERYKLPMTWGVYDFVGKKEIMTSQVKPEDIPGPGYHWLKVGTTRLTGHDYLFFFWSWIIQVDLHEAFPGVEYDIWANLKFEGPAFPHGKSEDKNAISVDQVVLVKK